MSTPKFTNVAKVMLYKFTENWQPKCIYLYIAMSECVNVTSSLLSNASNMLKV